MKHFLSIFVLCLLSVIALGMGCNKKNAVDPSQELVHELFPTDQEEMCNLLFDSADALGKIMKHSDCESLLNSLADAPKDLLDNYENGLMGCRMFYMTQSEADEFGKTASAELTQKVMKTSEVDKLVIQNVCENAKTPSKDYLEFKARMDRIYKAFFRKKALAVSCSFYKGLSVALSEHKEDCDKVAEDFEKYLDAHLDEFNKAIRIQETAGIHLFDTAEGQRDYGRCFSQISYPDSPYTACVQAQNMKFIRVNAKMMQVTTDIQRTKLNNQAVIDGGNMYVSVENSYIDGFARNVEVTDGNCENMGIHLNRFVEAIKSGMDLVRAQDLTNELDPDLGPAKNRKKKIQEVFGKNAPVQKCMGNAEVRKAYDKMVDGLKIRNLI